MLPRRPRLGAVSFLHRFGSALNRHVHLHACVTDGLFMPDEDGVAFLPPGRDGSPERIRFSLPRHKRGQWVGPGRRRKATSPGQHGVFAPNHPLRPAVTVLAIGNATARPAAARAGPGSTDRVGRARASP